MEVAWVARECSVGQRTSVCGGVDEGIKSDVGDQDEAVNSVPPTNGWADGTDEPRTGTVS